MMISDEAVEAAAIASYVRAGGGTPESWPREDDHYRREYLEDATVQLEAAAPYMLVERQPYVFNYDTPRPSQEPSVSKNGPMNLNSIEHVTREQIAIACRALGLDPDATHSITITAEGVAAEVIEGDTFARYKWPVV